MLKHPFSVLVYLALLASPAVAADAFNGAFDCPKGSAIKDGARLLEQAQSKYQELSSMSARFVQESYLMALDTSELSHGLVWYQKPGQMKWDYTEPEAQTFIVKDKTTWFYQPTISQVMIDSLDKVVISDVPVAFLMGIGDLTKDFSVKSACRTSEGMLLDLGSKASSTAKSGRSLKSFALLVGEGDSLPRGAKVSDDSGNVTTIMLSKPEANKALDASIFATTFPHGTDINDQRGINDQRSQG